jgi:hypothetical protein
MAGEQYGKVSRRMWRDEKFRAFSKAPPSARELWIYLLTSPRSTSIPGIVAVGAMGLAEDLDWPVKATRVRLAELEAAGVVKVDHEAKLLWLPNSLDHNPPANASVVLGWCSSWRLLPECPLRTMARDAIRAKLKEMDADACRDGRAGCHLAEAFEVATGAIAFADSALKVGRQKKKPEAPHDFPGNGEHGVPHGEQHGAEQQDQEQDQEQEQDRSDTHTGSARGVDQRPDSAPSTSRSPAAQSDRRTPDSADEILAHLAASPHPLPLIATLEIAQRFAAATMTGADVADIKQAITAAALTLGEHARAMLGDSASLDGLTSHVGRYIANQRSFDRKRGKESHAGTDADVERIVRHFADAWTKKRGQTYAVTDNDRDAAKTIRDLATQVAADERLRRPSEAWSPSVNDIVPTWILQYLGDADQYLVQSSWALRWLPSRTNNYKLPSRPWGQKAAPKAPKPAVELPPTKPPAREELDAMIANRVNGGNGTIVLRPGSAPATVTS